MWVLGSQTPTYILCQMLSPLSQLSGYGTLSLRRTSQEISVLYMTLSRVFSYSCSNKVKHALRHAGRHVHHMHTYTGVTLSPAFSSSQLCLIFLQHTNARATRSTTRQTESPTVTHRASGGNVMGCPRRGRKKPETILLYGVNGAPNLTVRYQGKWCLLGLP